MRERVPNLPVVAISGITALDFVSASPELADVVCLQKPFRPNQLVSAIEAAYQRSGRSIAGSYQRRLATSFGTVNYPCAAL